MGCEVARHSDGFLFSHPILEGIGYEYWLYFSDARAIGD